MKTIKLTSLFLFVLLISTTSFAATNELDALIQKAKAGDAKSQMALAGYYDQHKDKQSILWAKKAADQNEPLAIAFLGAKYLEGKDVEKNIKKAEELFQKASSLGGASTDYLIGVTYAQCKCENNQEHAFKWYNKAADGGYLPAIHDVGGMYDTGYYVKQDHQKGFSKFLTAAQKGYWKSMKQVSGMYAQGIGVEKDQVKAREWYEKANTAMIAEAMNKALKK